MKRTYITPELQIVEMEPKQLIMAGSIQSAQGLDGIDDNIEEFDPSSPINW